MLAGKVRRVGDLNPIIESLGEPFTSNYVEAPLFFSLVNQSYGPLTVPYDPSVRLRDRTVQLSDPSTTKDEFVKNAHAAWLAQALYRLRLENFPREDVLVAFFGDDYDTEAQALLAVAQRFVATDITSRNG